MQKDEVEEVLAAGSTNPQFWNIVRTVRGFCPIVAAVSSCVCVCAEQLVVAALK